MKKADKKERKIQKLVLSKETLRLLSSSDLQAAVGGMPPVAKDLTCDCTGQWTASCMARCGGCTDYC